MNRRVLTFSASLALSILAFTAYAQDTWKAGVAKVNITPD